MRFNIEKLKQIAQPMSEEARTELKYRDENREFLALSEKFALKVGYLLRKNGMTQADLAERMKVSTTQISKILSGKENIQLKTISKLQIALGTNLINFEIEEEEEIFYKLVEKYISRIPSTTKLMASALEQVEIPEKAMLSFNAYSTTNVPSLI